MDQQSNYVQDQQAGLNQSYQHNYGPVVHNYYQAYPTSSPGSIQQTHLSYSSPTGQLYQVASNTEYYPSEQTQQSTAATTVLEYHQQLIQQQQQQQQIQSAAAAAAASYYHPSASYITQQHQQQQIEYPPSETSYYQASCYQTSGSPNQSIDYNNNNNNNTSQSLYYQHQQYGTCNQQQTLLALGAPALNASAGSELTVGSHRAPSEPIKQSRAEDPAPYLACQGARPEPAHRQQQQQQQSLKSAAPAPSSGKCELKSSRWGPGPEAAASRREYHLPAVSLGNHSLGRREAAAPPMPANQSKPVERRTDQAVAPPASGSAQLGLAPAGGRVCHVATNGVASSLAPLRARDAARTLLARPPAAQGEPMRVAQAKVSPIATAGLQNTAGRIKNQVNGSGGSGRNSSSSSSSTKAAVKSGGSGSNTDDNNNKKSLLISRRKNATRETTAMLKDWLDQHGHNPYPTKGEKIMLSIITKMSLNQVSTWFANARRRMKKEDKSHDWINNHYNNYHSSNNNNNNNNNNAQVGAGALSNQGQKHRGEDSMDTAPRNQSAALAANSSGKACCVSGQTTASCSTGGSGCTSSSSTSSLAALVSAAASARAASPSRIKYYVHRLNLTGTSGQVGQNNQENNQENDNNNNNRNYERPISEAGGDGEDPCSQENFEGVGSSSGTTAPNGSESQRRLVSDSSPQTSRRAESPSTTSFEHSAAD